MGQGYRGRGYRQGTWARDRGARHGRGRAGNTGRRENAKKSAGRSAGHRGGAKKKSVPDRGL